MPKVYEFKITLRDTEPAVWRQIRIHAEATFGDLHEAIQDAFGWEYAHIAQFRAWSTTRRPGKPIADDDSDTPLRTLFKTARRKKCEYIYDFGDEWRHAVELVGMPEVKTSFERRLMDGALACPLEDCGGTHRYALMAEFVRTDGANVEDEEDAEDLSEWVEGWHPDRLNLTALKRRFAR